MKKTPKRILALVSTVLLMQLSGPICVELFPQVFQGRPLRKLVLVAFILSLTLPLLLRAHRDSVRDARRSD
jgi:hypothetical protein